MFRLEQILLELKWWTITLPLPKDAGRWRNCCQTQITSSLLLTPPSIYISYPTGVSIVEQTRYWSVQENIWGSWPPNDGPKEMKVVSTKFSQKMPSKSICELSIKIPCLVTSLGWTLDTVERKVSHFRPRLNTCSESESHIFWSENLGYNTDHLKAAGSTSGWCEIVINNNTTILADHFQISLQ